MISWISAVVVAAVAVPHLIVRRHSLAELAVRRRATRRPTSCAIDLLAADGLPLCRRLDRAVAVVDQGRVISRAAVGRVGRDKMVVASSFPGAVIDQVDPVRAAVANSFPVAVADRIVRVAAATIVPADRAVVETIVRADRAAMIGQGVLAMAIDRADPVMVVDPADPATVIVPDVLAIDRVVLVRVAVASNGGREIGRIIAPIAIRTGISGKIGDTTSGRTPTTSGETTGTTTTATSAAIGGTTIPIGGSTTTSTTGVGPRGRP
jgi:hypothetical protein